MLALQGDTYPPPLHLLGRHDDDVRVLLVDHLPEVHHRDLQAALRGDEHFALLPGTALLPEALEADSGSERGGLPGAVRAKPRCVVRCGSDYRTTPSNKPSENKTDKQIYSF